MKTALTGIISIAVLALTATTATAQTNPPDSGAVLVGTFTGEVIVGDDEPNLGKVGSYEIEYLSWLLPSGETVLTIDASSAVFEEPCAWAENTSMEVLMQEAAYDGIKTAIALGYLSCGPSCPVTENRRVFYPTCVERDLSGSCQTLSAAATNVWSVNTYEVCCGYNGPSITLVSKNCGATTCGTGYERTCN